ncbi:probable multidrug resistance-associated protein lethal(2)03659 isoform X2 [Leptinotarsa decemlineata]|uniref:probable multidrug resistance-associated protein lethal(2)03659 isoform X2 n=1 Tax=Leptinotarsa decemlineata TaxID=7539 RepID=UPI003D305D10
MKLNFQKTFLTFLSKMRSALDEVEERLKNECPAKNANFLSKITFMYSLKLFNVGRKRDLTEEDLTKPLDEHKSDILGKKIAILWSKEYEKALSQKRTPSMSKVIVKAFYGDIIYYGIILLVLEIFVRYRSPMYFVRVFKFFSPNQGPIQKSEAYFFATGIMLCSCIVVMVMHPYLLAVQHVGMKIRVACCSLIYRKALRIQLTALGGRTVGNAVNLMSNDVVRFDMAPMFVHYLWIAPLQLFVILYFMYKIVDISSVIGLLAIFVFIPLQVVLGIRTSVLRKHAGARTDERVRQMNEIIKSMQVIKMYAWENAFAKLIANLRKSELSVLTHTSFIRGTIMSFIMFTTRLGIFLTVMSYVLNGSQITAEKVFVITSYYQVLRQTMTVYFPQGIATVAESLVSIRRIQKFMLTEETSIGDPTPLDPLWQNKPKKVGLRRTSSNTEVNLPFIELSHGMAKYGEDVCLEDINLEAWPGKLTAVVGPVGAGKSCLLNLITGELPLFSGRLRTNGIISYASQEPWLFAGSVRQNILFGREFELLRYRDVIKACALTRDFSLFPFGDRTIVGERGISLSGGQRARINLARCVYKRADIYLLDDPLSAVDINVGQQLFEGCIKKYLEDKIVILITHQLQYLKRADRIIILSDGMIHGQGTYKELLGTSDFSDLLREASTAMPTEEKEVEKVLRAISITSTAFNSMIDIEGRKKTPFIIPEMRTVGSVDFLNYKEYFRAGANCCGIFIMIFLFLFAQLLASGGDYFLSRWVDLEELRFHFGSASSSGFFDSLSRKYCIHIYTAFIVCTIIVALTRSLVFFSICMRSSMRLHNRMFISIIHASMRFFNVNSSGRILNRFSKDLGAVDELLPNAFIDTVQLMLNLVGAIIVVSFVEPYLLVPTCGMVLIFYLLRRLYLSTSRNVKRLEGITRSPVFAHLNATLQGITTIRTNGAEKVLVDEFDKLQDIHSSAWFMFLYTSRAFGLWLDLVCTLFIGIVTFSFVILADDYSGSSVGVAITQCIGLSGLVQWGMRQSAELENQMTSVERVLEFTKIEHESDLESRPDKKPPISWPKQGKIEFIDTTMRYAPFEPPVLKHLHFVINPREKIGIVGRTGAGKSSLISALFRLAYYDGLILIDHLDISVIGLHDLRRKVSIIPQEPVLFSGTLRYNLDPFNEYSDADIFAALMDVEIRNAMIYGIKCLDNVMTEGGTNLSVGQRQMVCLARAILRNNLILIMDEATANVDAQTDKFIQKTIRKKFAHCTVLTIAHRLHTVMDSDRVLVMDAGSVVEFDHPHVLLQNRDGMLFDLVKKTGPGVSDTLKKVAQENYEARKSNAAQSQKPKAVQPGGSVQSQRDNATQPLRDSDEEEESPRNG